MLDHFRQGDLHLRASWMFTRMDMLVSWGAFAKALLVRRIGRRAAAMLAALAIGLQVKKDAIEMKEAKRQAWITTTTTLR